MNIDYIANTCDKFTKITSAILVAVVVTTSIVPIFGSWAKAIAAWRFGTNGVLKYELGNPANKEDKEDKEDKVTIGYSSLRNPTKVGNLFLLRDGPREFKNLRFGDILQADGPQRFRENNGCSSRKPTDCTTTSPEMFQLQTGECVVVLGKHEADSGKDDNDHINKSGGWVHVATAACGLFD